MCSQVVFWIYWLVGISAMVVLFNLLMEKVAKRHPGRKGRNTRRVASLPIAAAVYFLGMLLWGSGHGLVSGAVCPPDPADDVTRAPRQS